jgi:hypothetical protein
VDISLAEVTIAGRKVVGAAGRDGLARALYHAWHTGLAPDTPARPPRPPDPGGTRRLTAGVTHRTTRVPATAAPPIAGTATVRIDGVRVRVSAAAVLDAGTVAMPAVRPALYPGFVVVDGSLGRPAGPPLRLYLHVADAAKASDVVGVLTSALERRRLAYRMKVRDDPADFPRRDALVAYLPSTAWAEAPDLAGEVRGALGPSALRPDTSVFAERLAPGIAAAWEPVDARLGMAGLSFGIHRALAVAQGLTTHTRAGDPPSRRDAAVVAALAAASIDPAAPFRNLDNREAT